MVGKKYCTFRTSMILGGSSFQADYTGKCASGEGEDTSCEQYTENISDNQRYDEFRHTIRALRGRQLD
jgi:hypothetical protein